MNKILFLLPTIILFSCNKLNEIKPEDQALQAAKAYYDQLLTGDYDSFVEGSLQGNSVPADFKEQLLTNARMYIEQQEDDHQGIEKIEATRATCDSIKVGKDSVAVTANAFLTISYKDNSKEEISVPMVRKNKIWYMR